jgi:hypothetical protein
MKTMKRSLSKVKNKSVKLTIRLVKNKWQVRKGRRVLHECTSKKFAKESTIMWGRSPEKLKRDLADLRKEYYKALQLLHISINPEFTEWEKSALRRYSLVSKGKKIPTDLVRLFHKLSATTALIVFVDKFILKK